MPLQTDLSEAVVRALKLVYERGLVMSLLDVPEARMRVLEAGRGKLTVKQLGAIESATGADWELWGMVIVRRQAESAEEHQSIDDFFRIRKLKEIVVPDAPRKSIRRITNAKRPMRVRLSA